MSEALADLIADEVAHVEEHADEPSEGMKPTGRGQVFSVRLNADEVAAVQAIAGARNLPASTLVRTWILEQLSGKEPDAVALLQRALNIIATNKPAA